MSKAVLDSSAILAVINRESGRNEVLPYLVDAACSAANIAEVATKLADNGLLANEVRNAIDAFSLESHDLDHDDAIEVGLMRPLTRSAGLSLGDRSCLQLARKLGLPAITADRQWADIADAVGVEVRIVR